MVDPWILVNALGEDKSNGVYASRNMLFYVMQYTEAQQSPAMNRFYLGIQRIFDLYSYKCLSQVVLLERDATNLKIFFEVDTLRSVNR